MQKGGKVDVSQFGESPVGQVKKIICHSLGSGEPSKVILGK